MDYGVLRDEITNDPLGRGYAAMTNGQVADDLNNEYREVTRGVLSGSAIFNAIVPSEFDALTDAQKSRVRDVFFLGDQVDVGPGTNARTVLLNAFGAGTTTRTNLQNAVTVNISRAEELGLSGVGGTDVAIARNL